MKTDADFEVENHGTLFLFRPLNAEANEHLRENVEEAAQWWGDALVCEHRFAWDLAQALLAEGFVVV